MPVDPSNAPHPRARRRLVEALVIPESDAKIPAPDARDERVLLAEADHRIANHLALLTGYVRLQAAALADQVEAPSHGSMQVLLDGVGVQIDAIARLHRALACGGPSGSANLSEHLHEICAGFTSGLSGEIQITEDLAPGCAVRPDQILPLTRIVAEVVTNAVKHARGGDDAGTVLVSCSRDEGGELLVEVTDNGPGLPASFDFETDGRIGFRLLRALSRQLGAHTGFHSTRDGLRFRLTLPSTA